jgi:hypothetical protein
MAEIFRLPLRSSRIEPETAQQPFYQRNNALLNTTPVVSIPLRIHAANPVIAARNINNLTCINTIPLTGLALTLPPKTMARVNPTLAQQRSVELLTFIGTVPKVVVVVARPFNQYDWPVPRTATRSVELLTAINVPVRVNPPPQLPFNKTDWPNPGLPPRIDLTWIRTISLSSIALPFNQYNWPNPIPPPRYIQEAQRILPFFQGIPQIIDLSGNGIASAEVFGNATITGGAAALLAPWRLISVGMGLTGI